MAPQPTLEEELPVPVKSVTRFSKAGEMKSKVRGRYLSERASMVSHRVSLKSGTTPWSHFNRTSSQVMVSWERTTCAVLAARDGVNALQSGSWGKYSA